MKRSPDEPGLPPAVLYERVRASIDASSAVGLRTSTRISLALLAAPLLTALVASIASYVVYGQPAQGLDVHVESLAQLWLVLSVFTAITLASTYIALSQGRTGLGAAVAILAVIACAVAPLYAILVVPEPLHPGDAWPDDISPWGARCLLVASIVIALSLSSFVLALRRAVTVAVHWRGAALGAAAGAWAGLALLFFCPAGEALHLIVGHALPVFAATILGFVLAPAILRT